MSSRCFAQSAAVQHLLVAAVSNNHPLRDWHHATGSREPVRHLLVVQEVDDAAPNDLAISRSH